MKKIIFFLSLVSALMVLGLVSCKSDDPDDGSIIKNKEMISPEIPVSSGWSGSLNNGIAKYVPVDDEYSDEDPSVYFAFEMKDGKCESGVYNMVMESAMEAKILANMFSSGTWVNIGDDDDDDDDYPVFASTRSVATPKVFNMVRKIMEPVSLPVSTRANFVLPIPVRQEGSVIYMVIPNAKGVSSDDLRDLMALWSGESRIIPDRVIFGTYKDGVYVCNNMGGINMKYVVTTEFDEQGLCTKYTTSITLPNEGWAMIYYASYQDQLEGYEEQYGQCPDLTLEGTTVTLDALILADFTKSYIDAMIYSLDWINNCPILYSFFN